MKTVLATIALAVFTVSAWAQATGPETAARAQVDAMVAADWPKFTAQMHPKALARFRELMLPVAEAVIASNEKGAAQVWRNFFGTLPKEKLRAFTPAEFFESFMRNLATTNPAFVENYKAMKVEFIGTVKEGAAIHLVSRSTRDIAGVKVTTMGAATFEADETGVWRSVLSGEIEQTAAALRQQFIR
jgi:hypothetical protein